MDALFSPITRQIARKSLKVLLQEGEQNAVGYSCGLRFGNFSQGVKKMDQGVILGVSPYKNQGIRKEVHVILTTEQNRSRRDQKATCCWWSDGGNGGRGSFTTPPHRRLSWLPHLRFQVGHTMWTRADPHVADLCVGPLSQTAWADLGSEICYLSLLVSCHLLI